MVIRRAFGDALPAQGHWFNAGPLYKRFTPAGPDHAQIAACAGMADYIDALHARHFAPDPDALARGRAVHDLMRDQEVTVVAPLLDYLAARNDVRLIGPRQAADRAPTVAVALPGAAEPVAVALADKGWKQALRDNPHLKNGLNVAAGRVTFEAVARDLGYDYLSADALLA